MDGGDGPGRRARARQRGSFEPPDPLPLSRGAVATPPTSTIGFGGGASGELDLKLPPLGGLASAGSGGGSGFGSGGFGGGSGGPLPLTSPADEDPFALRRLSMPGPQHSGGLLGLSRGGFALGGASSPGLPRTDSPGFDAGGASLRHTLPRFSMSPPHDRLGSPSLLRVSLFSEIRTAL